MTNGTVESAPWPETVDFVVVGGGQSGLVVASRLSEDPAKTVVVLEAGANRLDDPRIDTPGLMTTLYDDPAYDWKHMTVPQPHANGRQIAWPRGKVLGGTSAMNFSALVYPARSDFDNWAALGNAGWGADDMAPYMKKFHRYQTPEPALAKRMMMDWADADAQGYDGPVPTAFTPELGLFNEAWMKAFENLGYRTPEDPINGNKQGVFQNPLSIDLETGKRAYAASAYYNENVAKRTNLHVITDALVERLVLRQAKDGSDQVTVTGVEYIDSHPGGGSDNKHIIHAAKEVIIACGTVKTPQVLELSGIGSKEHLARYGIEVIVENPQVGENLQDHVLASISFEIADGQISGDIMRDPKVVEAVTKLYQETHAGPLSGTPLSFAYTPLVGKNGALPTSAVESLLESHLERPSSCSPAPAVPSLEQQHQRLRSQVLDSRESSIEFMYIPLQLNGHPDGGETDMTTLFSKVQDGNYITIVAMLMRPFSRGSVHLASADAAAQPRVDPRYLSHPMDMEMLAHAVLYAEKVASTEPLAGMLKQQAKGGRRIPEGLLGKTNPVQGDDDDEEALEKSKKVVRQRLFTAFHPSGTCAMLPREMGGVVDSRLRVYGTRNLRVVDASVFPMEPLGHLQSTVYAVAERAADLIKADW